eukprot:CAMPEP_0178373550 /NCGR_PEP_ID=MMETSP0689_2-20121128/1919_1 /TAXON_ID=160604 /ORGANISM="Amphidinium massartii, Strain CS-259" /LENGTH=180 /DNA_ID=CAMNT_0019993493 /DNA_START=58 /DNA_END=597 /DNA_ORIENTATION=-
MASRCALAAAGLCLLLRCMSLSFCKAPVGRRAAVFQASNKLLLGWAAGNFLVQAPHEAGAAQQLPLPAQADCPDCVIAPGPATLSSSPPSALVARTTEQQIRDIVSSNTVVVFSKSYCPFCFMAKTALMAEGVDFKVVELDSMPAAKTQEFQAELMKMTGARTVPRVFVRGSCIGGGEET